MGMGTDDRLPRALEKSMLQTDLRITHLLEFLVKSALNSS